MYVRMYVRMHTSPLSVWHTYIYLSIPSQSPKNLAQTILTYVSTHKGTTKLWRCVTAQIKMTESHTSAIFNIQTYSMYTVCTVCIRILKEWSTLGLTVRVQLTEMGRSYNKHDNEKEAPLFSSLQTMSLHTTYRFTGGVGRAALGWGQSTPGVSSLSGYHCAAIIWLVIGCPAPWRQSPHLNHTHLCST